MIIIYFVPFFFLLTWLRVFTTETLPSITMQRYGYKATNRNKNKTVMLYFANMKIAQAFHPLLSSFEVILRNQLHYALARHFSDGNWIINQKSGFMVASSLTYTNKRTKKKVTNDYILKDFVQNVGDPPAEENFNFINL